MVSLKQLGPALVVGVGLGAFADGILFHQVLQWHHILSEVESDSTVDGLQVNTHADGAFHVFTYLLLVAGLVWAWRRRDDLPRRSGREVLGAVLLGVGLWHVVDQVLFHLVLRLHHIRPGPDEQLYDWGYTAIGVAIALVGLRLLQREQAVASAHAARR